MSPWKIIALCGLFSLLIIFGLLWRIDSLKAALEMEKAAHGQTLEKASGWKLSYEKILSAAQAQRDLTQACLDREDAARAAREDRAEILRTAPSGLRTEEEKSQVVNEQVRLRAAARLNRPW